jgi:protocatechuate 3,4-dioxygenase beta subunit
MIALLLMWLLGQPPGGIPGPKGTGVIRGHVVRADGRPLPRAQVRLTAAEHRGLPRVATTSEDGAYQFADLPADSYTLIVAKTGYVSVEFGQRQAFSHGQPIKLAAGEKRERVDVALPRHGAIQGRVLDENGDALDAVRVTVMQARFVAGRRQLVPVKGVAPRRTNELGRYRVYGLQPGDYIVMAEVGHLGTDDLPDYGVTYFPGTPNPVEAARIRVGLAEEVANVDFALALVKTAKIAGHTFMSNGEPFQGGVQMKPSRRSGTVAAEQVGARTSSDGGFEFPNVPPGEYVICAFKSVEIGWQFVTVGGSDVTDVAVQTLAGSTITGRITFEGADPPKPRDIELSPVPSDPDLTPFVGGPGSADIRGDWTFEITSVSGPRYLRVVRAPKEWVLKAVLVNGQDAIDMPLPFGNKAESLKDVEIVLTDRTTTVSGTVAGVRDTSADADAIVFATNRQLWYGSSRFLAHTAVAPDGTFTLRGLPAGDYYVVAVDRVPGIESDDEWQDPAVLDVLARQATRVTLGDGESRSLTLRLSAR